MFFENFLKEPPYPGGCPLLNSAAESDDTNAGLRQQSFGMLVNLKSCFKRVLETGIEKGEVKLDMHVAQTVCVFIATLEGSIIISKLERNNDAITSCIAFLTSTHAGLRT